MKSLDEVIGHSHMVSYLKNKIEKDAVPQVIILHGNSGLGKTSIARILGVEINAIAKPEMRESLVREIIVNKGSNSCVKHFNMSSIDEDAIENVVAELNVGLSPTGRKVLILDEAHNMLKKHQDSILVLIDPPPEGVYIIFCTTEIGGIRDTLISRTGSSLYFKNLSINELRQLGKKLIREKGLRFEIGEERFLHYLAIYTNRQARNVVNFIANFEDNSLVTSKHLEVFIDTTVIRKAFRLIEYLYGSMATGIQFIQDLRLDTAFTEALTSIVEVVLDHKSDMVSKEEVDMVKDFFRDKDISNLIKFTSEVCSLSRLEKRLVTGAFMRNSKEFEALVFPVHSTNKLEEVSQIRAVNEIEGNPTVMPNVTNKEETIKAPTLESLFRGGSVVDK